MGRQASGTHVALVSNNLVLELDLVFRFLS